MTTDLVAAVLGLGEIIVGDTVENTGDKGQTFVGADIWTDITNSWLGKFIAFIISHSFFNLLFKYCAGMLAIF